MESGEWRVESGRERERVRERGRKREDSRVHLLVHEKGERNEREGKRERDKWNA